MENGTIYQRCMGVLKMAEETPLDIFIDNKTKIDYFIVRAETFKYVTKEMKAHTITEFKRALKKFNDNDIYLIKNAKPKSKLPSKLYPWMLVFDVKNKSIYGGIYETDCRYYISPWLKKWEKQGWSVSVERERDDNYQRFGAPVTSDFPDYWNISNWKEQKSRWGKY